MNFAKENKKYFFDQLKGNITNNFNFTIKSLHQKSTVITQPPIICGSCSLPLSASVCFLCKTDNKLPSQTKFQENFVYKEPIQEGSKMQDSMILCIDLSGSMSSTYRSKYKKVNQELVCRILGQKNYEYLKKKLGFEKVMNNYSVYQMLLNQGQSARNIAQMVRMEQNSKYGSSQKSKQGPVDKKVEQKEQYISRKQIIEIAVAKCLSIMKSRNPNTQITAVYFNNMLQIPIDNFHDKLIIPGIQNKDVEQMIMLGVEYATQISRSKASNIGQNLVMNLTKASEDGQTALGPALAFCLGLSKAFKQSLTQVVVITDGMSNIGFGQTENELQKQATINFYKQLALKYAKPLNCIVDVVTFEDCCIGYDQLDGMVELTGGIPCQMEFMEQGGEKIVTEDTFSSLSFRMINAFCEYVSQLCFQTRTIIACNNENIVLKIPYQLKPFVEVDKGNYIVLKTGIRSGSSPFQIQFSVAPNVEQMQSTVKFTIISQFFKNSKKTITLSIQKIKVLKGSKAQAEKQQATCIQKQLKQRLRPRQIFQQDLKQYGSLSMKIEQNENIANNLDKELLNKFKMKKQMIEAQFKNIDKLARQKMSIRSRAQKTFKEKEDDFDDGFL